MDWNRIEHLANASVHETMSSVAIVNSGRGLTGVFAHERKLGTGQAISKQFGRTHVDRVERPERARQSAGPIPAVPQAEGATKHSCSKGQFPLSF